MKSAGASVGATVPLTRELVKWADEIYVMEFKHQIAVLKIMPSAWKKGRTLDAVYLVKDTLDLAREDTAYNYIKRYAVQEMEKDE